MMEGWVRVCFYAFERVSARRGEERQYHSMPDATLYHRILLYSSFVCVLVK